MEACPVRRACEPSESRRQPTPDLACGLPSRVAVHWMLAPPTGLRHYLKAMQDTDQTFKGLYHWNLFDAAVLLPYFAVMIVLALYGVHRYTMCYLYFRYRKNYSPDPPRHFEELPMVTVQLPIFNEQFVIDRLIEAVCAMEYPREKLEIQVLDDSTDETQQVAAGIVARYAALGHPIEYIHRTNRYGYKAGALDAGLKVAKGEFVAIFDADFVPPPDWLMKVIHHFAEPEIGMVQTRWTHLNRDYSMLTQIEAILLDGHFVLEHGARVRTGDFFNFNGTAGMWRIQAIADGGGWQHDTLTEDTDLSYRSQLAGWKFKYLPEVECPSELPIEMTAFKTQQARWAKGLIQTSIKVLPHDVPVGGAAPHQDRGCLPSDGQPQLSADGCHVGAVDAGHDLPLLSGLVPDAADRRAAVHCFDLFHRGVLPDERAGAVPEDLDENASSICRS